jgi:hypothetical protein
VTSLDPAKALRIISRAWGGQDGYAFFPHIDREEQVSSGERQKGYHESRAFKWPQERKAILEHMKLHLHDDLYWCPSLFEGPHRKIELAMDEHAMWADLDEVDPRQLDDFRPTVAWETSPGRYQGLWLGNPATEDFLGASWPGNENQRLTYLIGADKSGWDTTQLLRIPGWDNHKPEYSRRGKPVPGKLLWDRGPLYEFADFKGLPEVRGALSQDKLGEILDSEIEAIDVTKVKARIKLKLNQRARELLTAHPNTVVAKGEQGDNLWYLLRCIAEAGCTVQEIVAIAKVSVWNKFAGRGDELKRLITEATKAIDQLDPELVEKLEDEQAPKARPSRIAGFLKDIKPPTWLIDKIATAGSVGFIAGAPKSFKSWIALDMALSIATGIQFLDHFNVVKPGPVLYIQEEDSAVTVKNRIKKIWAGKSIDKMRVSTPKNGKPEVWWEPRNFEEFDPDIDIYLMEGFTASEGHWQEWLDETLTRGMEMPDGSYQPYVMLIVDTLMNTAGDVEENKSQQMTTRLFKPMKLLMRKHNCAMRFVHHMGKGSGEGQRGGQKMLGGTANHAWAEDSLYISRTNKEDGKITLEFESKTVTGESHTITGLDNAGWTPFFEPPMPATTKKQPILNRDQPIIDLLAQGGLHTTKDIAAQLNQNYNTVYGRLRALSTRGDVTKQGKQWALARKEH